MVTTWKAPLGALVVTLAFVGLATLTWALLPGKAEAQSCGSTGAPAVSDFEVVSWRSVPDPRRVHIVGELANNGPVAGRATIEVILRDESGAVVEGYRGNGTGGPKVEPGDRRFMELFFSYDKPYSTIELRVIGAD